MRRSTKKDLIFSHGYLDPKRIIVTQPTITGWEFAGFYPRGFDGPRFDETGQAILSDVQPLKLKRDLLEAYLISNSST